MKLARRVAFAVAALYLSLAICVLGRPLPSPASSQNSAMEVLERSSLHPCSPLLRFLRFPALEVPFKQERRLLKGSGGRGVRVAGYSGGSGGESTTVTIIIIASTAAFLLLLAALLFWCNLKKKRNPNWRFVDCFHRKKPAAEKLFTSVKSDVDPDAAAEHKRVIDVPRLDHTAKSRKQASLGHDFNSTSSLK